MGAPLADAAFAPVVHACTCAFVVILMGKKGLGRVTDKDISKAGGLEEFLKQLVKSATDGTDADKEVAAAALKSLATQNHGDNVEAIAKAGAVKPLLHLLVSGSFNAQSSACGCLAVVAQGRLEVQEAICSGGGVPSIVKLLRMGGAAVQEQAAAALAALHTDKGDAAAIKGGCIPPLVAMLRGASAAAQAHSAQALANVADYSVEEGQNAIARAGAIPLLVTLLGSGRAQVPAARALGKLVRGNGAIQAEVNDGGGIPPLLSLLNGLDVEAQMEAAAALSETARDNPEVQAAVARAGGIGPLLALLGARASPFAFQAQAQGMNALAQLARHNRDNQDAIARVGGIKPHVQLLESPKPFVMSSAACALKEITAHNPPNQQAVVDNAGIAQLANLMKNSQYPEVKAEVAGALWSLSADAGIKVQIASASAIHPLVQLFATDDARALQHSGEAVASLGLDNTANQVQITRLLIDLLLNGTIVVQRRAVTALRRLVSENPNAHADIAKAGDPTALVELLKNGIAESKEYALWSLSLSISTESQAVVADAGGVQPIISQLSDARTFILEQAAAALAKLAYENEATRAAITQAGGVKPLIGLLRTDGADFAGVRRNGANALANLASDTTARDEIVGSDGIRPLVRVLSEEQNATKKYAARALARLSIDSTARAAADAKSAAAEIKAAAEAAAVVERTTQAAIAEAGAIEPLVRLLEGNCGPEAQEEAAGALFALAEHEGNRLRITAADGIAWLVQLLGNERAKTREHAEGALVRLSIEPANRAQIIRKLVNMLQDAGAGGQEQAAAALANLARESEDNRKSIVDASGILPLLALLESTSPVAKENAVGAIAELCRNSKSIQSLIAKEGGIPKLVGAMLDFSAANKERSMIQLWTLDAAAIKEMAKGNRKNQDAIAEAGAIAPLVAMLGSSAPQMQANAAGALANLASGHPDNQSAIAKTGAVAPLCLLIKEGVGQQTKDESAQAIWSLAADHQPNKDMIAKLGGFDPLLGLLVTGTTERSQKSIAGALAALAAKHNENRQIIAKRLVGLLGSSAVKTSDRAERLLLTCSTFSADSAANQVAIAKLGGIPPLNTWLGNMAASTQTHAAQAVLCLATDNATTQLLIAKSDGAWARARQHTRSHARTCACIRMHAFRTARMRMHTHACLSHSAHAHSYACARPRTCASSSSPPPSPLREGISVLRPDAAQASRRSSSWSGGATPRRRTPPRAPSGTWRRSRSHARWL